MSVTFIFSESDGSLSTHVTELLPQFNLLAHAQMDELQIGSRCGGHGECGGDRIQVACSDPAGLSPITREEQELLSEADLKKGWRLGCQVFAMREGIQIQVKVPLPKRSN